MFFSACIDCVVDWGVWEPCADGKRSRSQIVTQDVVGAGNACPELQVESEGLRSFEHKFSKSTLY